MRSAEEKVLYHRLLTSQQRILVVVSCEQDELRGSFELDRVHVKLVLRCPRLSALVPMLVRAECIDFVM